MSTEQPEPADDRGSLGPRVVIEMGGANIVVRATSDVDRGDMASLADVLNAASDTGICVVIDPASLRCDDVFARYRPDGFDRHCASHAVCRPVPAEVAGVGLMRVRAERSTWVIDVGRGRVCRVDTDDVDVRYLGPDAWTPVVAVSVSPSRIVALGVDGRLVSAERAHEPAAV